MKKSYLRNIALIFLFTFLALWFVLKDHFFVVIQIVRSLNARSIVQLSLCGLAYPLIIGCIYKVLCNEYKNTSYKEGVEVSLVGSFFSGITPSATGGQIAQYYILKKQGLKNKEVASVLWTDFIVYQSVLVIYTAILMILRFSYYYNEHSQFFLLAFIGFLVNSAVIIALYAVAIFPKLDTFICNVVLNFLGRIKVVKEVEKEKIKWENYLHSFIKEIKKIRHKPKLILKCVCLNILRLTLLYALPYVIVTKFGIHVSPAMIIDIITMSAFVASVNAFIPIPGSSGGSEASFMLIFSTMFEPALTSAIVIIWRFITYHQIIIVGGICFVYLKHKYEQEKLFYKKYELEGEKR